MNSSFIKLHTEVIKLKSELDKRCSEYLVSNEHHVEPKTVDKAVLINVFNKMVSKRNIEALGKVQFSARVDFSADGELRIAEIENINNIEATKLDSNSIPNELETLLSKIRTAKQKQLLSSYFFDLKQTYILEGETAFNKKYKSISCLTKALLICSFKENS